MASSRGFTLIEMALVLLILAVLSRAAIVPLSAAQDHRKRLSTANQLERIHESVIAFVVSYGFLPCPIPATHRHDSARWHATGQHEDLPGNVRNCKQNQGGLPGYVLGLSGSVNDNGALLDAWNRPYLYSVSLSNHPELGNVSLADWTTAGEASRVGVPNLSAEIVICNKATQVDCRGTDIRANQIVFVVLSTGRDSTGVGNQQENLDNDHVFLSLAESKQRDTFFDDQLVWSTAADIMYWMMRMGWLP